jgi:hypothetical protein
MSLTQTSGENGAGTDSAVVLVTVVHAALAAHHATEHGRRLLDELPHLLSQPLAQYRLIRLGT